MSDQSPPNSLLRNLGEFFGHIVHAVKNDPDAPAQRDDAATTNTEESTHVRTTVEEHVSPDGKVVLRRTTIDEVVKKDPNGANGGK